MGSTFHSVVRNFAIQADLFPSSFMALESSALQRYRSGTAAAHRFLAQRYLAAVTMQGGGLVGASGEASSESIYGRLFSDENFALRHSGVGLVAMANVRLSALRSFALQRERPRRLCTHRRSIVGGAV
jgi:hypothetical protein